MRVMLLLISLFVVIGCQSDRNNSESQSIGQLERAYEENPTEETMIALMNAYKADTTSESQLRLATLQIENDFTAEGVTSLKTALKKEADPEKATLLASAYQKIQPSIIEIVYQIIAAAFPDEVDHSHLQKASVSDVDLDQNMQKFYRSTYSDSLQQILPNKAKDYIEMSEVYAILMPQNEKSALHLKRSGELARTVQRFDKAVELYDWLLTNYPETKEAESALFLSAFTYENDLVNISEAQQRYEQFLKKYPKSDFADDAQFLLDNLGKDDSEILESLQKRQ